MIIPGIVAAGRRIPVGSAITRVASTTQTAASTAAFTINAPAGLTAGDLILFALFNAYQDETASTPDGFSLVANLSTGSNRLYLFTKVAGASEPATYSTTRGGADSAAGVCVAYRGASGVDVVGSIVFSKTAPSITPTTAGVLLGLFGSEQSSTSLGTITPPAGMTMVTSADRLYTHLVLCDENPSPSGATGDKTIAYTGTQGQAAVLLQIA